MGNRQRRDPAALTAVAYYPMAHLRRTLEKRGWEPANPDGELPPPGFQPWHRRITSIPTDGAWRYPASVVSYPEASEEAPTHALEAGIFWSPAENPDAPLSVSPAFLACCDEHWRASMDEDGQDSVGEVSEFPATDDGIRALLAVLPELERRRVLLLDVDTCLAARETGHRASEDEPGVDGDAPRADEDAAPSLEHIVVCADPRMLHPRVLGMSRPAWNALLARLSASWPENYDGRPLKATLADNLLAVVLSARFSTPPFVIARLYGIRQETVLRGICKVAVMLCREQITVASLAPASIKLGTLGAVRAYLTAAARSPGE